MMLACSFYRASPSSRPASVGSMSLTDSLKRGLKLKDIDAMSLSGALKVSFTN